jgi:leucyl aminopeptidase
VTPATTGRTSVVICVGDPGGSRWWQDADVVALALAPKPAEAEATPTARLAGDRAAGVLAGYRIDLPRVAEVEPVTGRAGEVTRVPALGDGLSPRLLLVGVGDGGPRDLRRSAAALARAARGKARLVTTLGTGSGPAGVRAVVEGLVLGGYAPPAGGVTPRTDSAPVGRVELIGDQRDPAVERGRLHAAATALARDLAETPANLKTPSWLADRAEEVAADRGLGVRIWRGPDLDAAGFGGLRAVGGGSASPPCLVRLDYRPDGARPGSRPVVLVGKGITFDSGGLSIKSRDAMVPMKTDMSGAAAVLAALGSAGRAGVRRPVVGLLPLAENAVSGSSYRPGDVVRVRGRTVEVANTDAEGRLVLADALSYADSELDPDLVVDLATLTGAASLGLGRRHAALYTGDDALAAALDRAGRDSGEPVWRMPLVEDYRGLIDSGVADLRQVSSDPHSGAGSIVAALFLREFAGRRRWAHLDIAGPARSDKDEHEVTRGATGFGARLLLRWLEGLRA